MPRSGTERSSNALRYLSRSDLMKRFRTEISRRNRRRAGYQRLARAQIRLGRQAVIGGVDNANRIRRRPKGSLGVTSSH